MKYEEIESLEAFLSDVEALLLNETRWVCVNFPKQTYDNWAEDMLDERNGEILKDLERSANIYAFFTAAKGSDKFALRYIGKTTRKLARQRIRNHLIKKNDKTGAKLSEIKAHIMSGGRVKLSWVTIDPESLRNYLEEELIKRHPEADWNRENAKRSKIKAQKPELHPVQIPAVSISQTR